MLVGFNCFFNIFTLLIGKIHRDTDVFLCDRLAQLLLLPIHLDARVHLAHLKEHKYEAAFALGELLQPLLNLESLRFKLLLGRVDSDVPATVQIYTVTLDADSDDRVLLTGVVDLIIVFDCRF